MLYIIPHFNAVIINSIIIIIILVRFRYICTVTWPLSSVCLNWVLHHLIYVTLLESIS